MDTLKTLGLLIVYALIALGIWLFAAITNGKNEFKYECNVQKITNNSDVKKSGRIFIGLDEYKWWAKVFRWDKPFEAITESDDFELSNFFYTGGYINDKEIQLRNIMGEKYDVRLSLLSGRFILGNGENISFQGICKKI